MRTPTLATDPKLRWVLVAVIYAYLIGCLLPTGFGAPRPELTATPTPTPTDALGLDYLRRSTSGNFW